MITEQYNAVEIETMQNAPAKSPLLENKINGLARRLFCVSATTGIGYLILCLVIMFSIGMLLDFILNLELWIRIILFALYATAVCLILYRYVVKPLIFKPTPEELALMVEKAKPIFKSRLISAIEFSKQRYIPPETSRALIKELIKETESIANSMDFRTIVKTDELKKITLLVLVSVTLFSVVFYQTKEVSVDLLKRLFLSSVEVPRKTRVEVLTGDKVVGKGDSIVIVAQARGIIPNYGELTITYNTGNSVQYTMDRSQTNTTLFIRQIDNLQSPFTYRVRLNDGVSRKYKVDVVARPETAFLECYQEYPAYTGLGTVKRSPGDLGILIGSKLHLKITASKEVKSGYIRLVGLDKDVPLSVNPQDRKILTAVFDVLTNKLTGFTIWLRDDYNIQSKDPVLYQIETIKDNPPVVRITYPERGEELYTRQAKVLIGFEASDDFGIAVAKLHYKINNIDNGSEKIIELDLGNEKLKNFRRRFEWDLKSLSPTPVEGSIIEYWMEIADANNVTGPGVSMSEHFISRIVTEAEKRADLMKRASEFLNGITDVTVEQEKLSRSLGELIMEKR